MHGGHESEKESREEGRRALTESSRRRAPLRWHRELVGRSGEGGRKGGRSGSPVAWQKMQARVRAVEAATRREGRVEMEMMSG